MSGDIVIVNHSLELGRLFSRMLAAYGYPVSLYRHWQQAFPSVCRRRPAAIVLDKHLTDATARAMCALLREHCPNTPILVWGLNWTPNEMRELTACGVSDFLSGATTAETLAAHIHHALAGPDHRKIA